MANEAPVKNETKAQPQASRPQAGEAIPIKALFFPTPGFAIPRTGIVVSQIDGVARKEGHEHYEIVLLPWLRQYRVTARQHNEPSRVFMVHESWASSEPID